MMKSMVQQIDSLKLEERWALPLNRTLLGTETRGTDIIAKVHWPDDEASQAIKPQ